MSEKRRVHKKKKNVGRKILIGFLFVFVAIAGVACGYSTWFFGRMERTKLPNDKDELGINLTNKKDKISNDVINIAFFGLDTRVKGEQTRSDSIMVVSIDKKNQSVKVTSLMRDMYVSIPDKKDNRINAAYALGGPLLAIKTINTNFGLDIKDYVTVDFFGLEQLVDKIGGVEITLSSAEAKKLNEQMNEINSIVGNTTSTVSAGRQLLNGRQAVSYSRIRYVGNSDFERTERQRRVLNEVFKKIKSMGVTRLPGVIAEILPNVQTSLSNAEMMSLATQALKFNADGIEQNRLPVNGLYQSQNINGASVLVPDLKANKANLFEFIYGDATLAE